MRRSTLFWGLVLLIVGILFLLENIGFLQVDVWNLLWPILLITLGVWIIAGRYIKRNQSDEFVSIPLDNAEKATFHIKHGAGRLNISSGADAGFGLQGTFSGGLDYHTQHIGNILDVTMKTPELDFPIFFGPGHPLDWSFGLSKDVPLSLKLDTGANEAHIDLRDANVTDIVLKSGASATEITLPSEAGFTQVEVHSGVASLTIHIPEKVAANIRTTGGLSSANIDPIRFPKGMDSYRSSDYDTAINKVNMVIEMGVGSVTVD
jgi:uncharacterized membrane protein